MSLDNRMEIRWKEMGVLLKTKWSQIYDSDLDYIDGKFDRLVLTLKSLYGGRAPIIQEAAIRDSLNEMLAELESRHS